MRTLSMLLIASTSLACLDEEPPLDPPQPIGLPIYKLSPTLCDDCRTLTLYRSDAAVELRAHQPNHEFAGSATASLSEATNAELDELLAALRSGE